MPFYDSPAGCRYHFAEEGDGFPMFMLHGIIQCGDEWRRAGWTGRLARQRRLILVDLPGHGDSSQPREQHPYRVESIAEAVLGMAETLGLERFDLMGFSLGGRVGYELAARSPERLRGLVVVAQHARAPRDEPRLERLIQLFCSGKLPAMERGMGIRSGAPGVPVNDAEAMATAIEALRQWPGAEADLPGISLPVLVASGKDDPAFARARESAAAIPNAEWVPLPGVDHNGTFYNAGASAGPVAAFLETLDGRL